MDEVTRKALEGIAAAVSWSADLGPAVLSEEYLRMIERVEALPESRPGTDKTWTERVLESWQLSVEASRIVRRG